MARKNRRGKGEGSIYRRADGYWVGSCEAGYRWSEAKGKLVRRQARVVRKSRADVVTALDELRRQVGAGVVPDRSRTLGQFLDWWLENVKAPQVKPETLRNYRNTATAIRAEIGRVRLHAVRKGHVEQVLTSATHLSPAARAARLSLLKDALNWAVGDDILTKNPAATVKAPHVRPKTNDIPTLAEHRAIMAAAEGDRLYALAWMATTYGMREGELLNLTWDDVDLDAKVLYVRESADGAWSPKSETSERTLPLIPQALGVLREHRKRQRAERMGSPVWHDQTGLVFTGTRRGIPGYVKRPGSGGGSIR